MALDALMVVSNPRKRKARFSPAQRRAQALFAKRAKSGAWRKNTKLSAGGRNRVHYKSSLFHPYIKHSYSKGSGTSGKVSQSSVERSGRRKVSPRGWTKSDMLKRYGSRADYHKNSRWSRSGSTAGKLDTATHFLGAKLRRKTSKTNKRTSTMSKRNPFSKRSAGRAARKFWRSAKGRKWKAARRAGHSIRAAWRIAKGASSPKRRRKGVSKRKYRRSSPKRHRKSIKHVRAGRIGAARKKARKGGMTSGFFLNPRRRRSKVRRRRHGRRAVTIHRRRRSHKRRRNTYVVANRRHYRRRSRRRNGPYFGIFTNKRRGRRRNMGGMINTLKPALFALGGFAAVRLIPSLIARVAPSVLGSVASAAGGWADVAVSGGALALLYYFGGRVPAVGGILSNPNLILGATISVVMDIALKVLPPNILGMIGLAPTAPALAGWSPGERTGAISGYVQTPVLGGYVQTPMLGAYVEAGGMGLDVRKALMGLGAEVTSGPCPGCTQLPANMAALPLGAQMRAKGFFGTRGYPIPAEQGAIAVPGIFRGSIFGG